MVDAARFPESYDDIRSLDLDKEAEVQRHQEAIGLIAAHRAATKHRLLTHLRRFDELNGWEGWPTCAHWLSYFIGLGITAAREHVRVAAKLGSLPLIDDALRRAEVSYSKVRAMTRVSNPERQETLLNLAKSASAGQLARLLQPFYRQAAVENGEASEHVDRRYVRMRGDMDSGLVKVEAALRPEEASLVMKGIHAATVMACGRNASAGAASPGVVNDGVSAGAHGEGRYDASAGALASEEDREREAGDLAYFAAEAYREERFSRADGLVALAEFFLDSRSRPDQVPGKYEVQLLTTREHLRGEDPPVELCETDDGWPISTQAARRMACDAAIVEVTTDTKGNVLDVGRRRRKVTAPLRRALGLRDKFCRFPGCANQVFVHAHHVEHWVDGGKTSLDNLVLLCRFHHHFLHEGGCSMRVCEDGSFEFLDRKGRQIPVVPQLPEVEGDALDAMEAQHKADGLVLASTNLRATDGSRLDYEWAVGLIAHWLGFD